jgi:hypothetical protein
VETYPYEPETSKHVYGKTDRWPGERLLVKHVNEIRDQFPGFRMGLLGTSGITGERFPLFRTRCIFRLPDEEAVALCRKALQDSDELIRRRIDALWTWEMMWFDGLSFMFIVNWYDFAFFMKNKEIFLGKDHGRYALDFHLDVKTIAFEHFKIFRDGTEAEFDASKISDEEREVVRNLDRIQFSRLFRDARF